MEKGEEEAFRRPLGAAEGTVAAHFVHAAQAGPQGSHSHDVLQEVGQDVGAELQRDLGIVVVRLPQVGLAVSFQPLGLRDKIRRVAPSIRFDDFASALTLLYAAGLVDTDPDHTIVSKSV